MIRYEILFLAKPEITNDEAGDIESQLHKAVKDNGGDVISFEKWGKYRLAYPIQNFEYGVYFLVRFEVAPEKGPQVLSAVRTLFMIKFNEVVVRHMIDRLATNASLEYQRPESLEDLPGRTTDELMKEHKVGRGRGDYRDREHAPRSASRRTEDTIVENFDMAEAEHGQES